MAEVVKINAYRAKDGTIHATEIEADRVNAAIAARDVFLCEDYRGPNVNGILDSIAATAQSRAAIKRFIRSYETEEDQAREAAEELEVYVETTINRVLTEGSFKIPRLSASSTYVFVCMLLNRLSNMTHREDYFEKADQVWTFIHENFHVEFVLYAMRAAYSKLYALPMDHEKQPALKAIQRRMVGLAF